MKSRGRIIGAALLLMALTAAIYAPVARHGFINYDDTDYITQNPRVRAGLTLDNVRWAFTTGHVANWHPLTWLSHMLDVRLFGLWGGGHHLTSVALHALNAVLLLLVLRGLTGAPGVSLLVAALFVVHPLRVESVAWVAERKDVLAGFFWMAGLGAWVRYLRRPGAARYLAVGALLALGLMAKPTLVTFPLVLLLLDWWPLGRLGPGADARRAGKLALEKAPLLLLSAASAATTFLVQRSWGAMDSADLKSPAVRLANAAVSYLAYLARTVWPRGLSVFYPHPAGSLPWWQGWGAAAALAGATMAVLAARSRRPWLAMGWLWYLGTLVPMIGLVQVGSQRMADRYTYLPLIGPVLALVWWMAEEAGRRGLARSAGWVGAAAVLVLALTARHQVGYWKDSETLFRHALAVTGDNIVAEHNLGNALAEQGRRQEAMTHYNQVVKARPWDSGIYNNIGYLLVNMGRPAEAEENYRKALGLNAANALAHNNLGIVLGMTGRHTEAVGEFREALRLRPEYAEARLNLGSALGLLGNLTQAVIEIREALRLDPWMAVGHNNLGAFLARQEKWNEAAAEYREALRLDPGYRDARTNLEEALARGAR